MMSSSFGVGIFDFDGTLVNSVPVWEQELRTLLKASYGFIDAFLDDIVLGLHGVCAKDYLKKILEESEINTSITTVNFLMNKWIRAVYAHEIPMFDGVCETIARLNEKRGVQLHISSRGDTAHIRQSLLSCGMEFEIVMGGDLIEKGQKHIDHIAGSLNLSNETLASKACFIGDTKVDMEIAKKAGLFAIGITNTQTEGILRSGGADAIISSIEEVLPFFGVE